jgi:peptidoglycan DL-endopeptidase CwlO
MTVIASLGPRMHRALLAAMIGTALVLAEPGVAFAVGGSGAGNGPADEVATLQEQARALASQIQADGRQLDQVAEAFDRAEIRSRQLSSRLKLLQVGIRRIDARVAVDRTTLRQQAILAYVTGGAPLIDDIPLAREGPNPMLAIAYSDILAGGERRVLAAYGIALASQVRQARLLTRADRQEAITVAALRADRTRAARAFATREAALAQVNGRLATLVAQVQAAQEQAVQVAIAASLARHHQLPPATPTVVPGALTPPRPGGSTARATEVAPGRAHPAPTTSPPLASQLATSPPASAPVTSAPPPASPPVTVPPTTAPPTTSPPTTAPSSGNVPAPGWQQAVAYAYAQLGKPYQWGGAGPNSFDCSGLTMMAWEAAGVYLPHLAQAQYDLTARISLADALPGDLIFYGTPSDVYHVGLYIGGGQMIDAPETGQDVSISSIYWPGLLGAGRVVG